ncbi:MAG TPA: lysophospholipid acyltransferase family protein [Candidatus Binatia bacterium]|jgi:glycerol-3-phosphate O-acyltransferase/dihydroxyacetone phosphate acyltransferase|nr:lysophospholipid acyltransferase family protein [Candidatus Binatia bacterium]
MSSPVTGLYGAMRGVVRLALGFYFRRIEKFHAERVPVTGPVLFTSNHPNSLTDSFVIGTSVPRRVNFVGTVQLFRLAPLKWLLTRCGVIPINRVKDDPKAMRTVAGTFEACFRVLEAGEAVGIFPEGITYEDSELKEVKSGAARMALELERRHGGKLGLQVVPVGLTYSQKEVYRSDVLVHFGEPLRAADFLDGYAERRKECITRLTAAIERRLQALILHLPQMEHARVVAGVKRLYLDRLRLGHGTVQDAVSPQAEALLVMQRIVEAVERVYQTQPERAGVFAAKLEAYERWLARLRIPDEHLALFPGKRRLAEQSLAWTLVALAGLPIALYGWLHRLIPFAVVRWAVHRFTEPGKRKAQASTAAIAAGVVAFVLCYSAYVLAFHKIFGWPASFWYALSLPLAGLAAHYYLRELQRLTAGVRNTVVLVRTPFAAKRLLTLRRSLIAEIEAVRAEVPPALAVAGAQNRGA